MVANECFKKKLRSMYSTWEFLKRNRRRILAGTAMAATIYGAKCLLESPITNKFIKEYFLTGGEETTKIEFDDACLNEARRHFLFDVHQQSCDKILRKIIVQLRHRIDVRFNTSDLLDELNNSTELSAQRKIEIWEQMKVRAIAKILSVLTIFPTVTLVMKTQKSMIQQIYHSNTQKQKQPNTLYESGIYYIKSFFNSLEDQQRLAIQNSAKVQNLFNSSLQYLFTEGIDLLFGILEQITLEIFSPIPLTEQFGSMDLHFLLERARAKIKAIGAQNNFSDFVIPTEQLNLLMSSQDARQFHGLLKKFTLILQTQNCRKLIDRFVGQYMESVLQYIDEAIPEGKALPFAKLIPRLCNFIPRITSTDYTSVFNETLTSTELHQFTLFISQCSKFDTLDELDFALAVDGDAPFQNKDKTFT